MKANIELSAKDAEVLSDIDLSKLFEATLTRVLGAEKIGHLDCTVSEEPMRAADGKITIRCGFCEEPSPEMKESLQEVTRAYYGHLAQAALNERKGRKYSLTMRCNGNDVLTITGGDFVSKAA